MSPDHVGGHDNTPAVDLRDLRVRYQDRGSTVRALRGVSLSVPTGQRLAVVGRSGSGKTSLIRVLSGLITPDVGEVRVAGHRLGEATRSGWPKAAYRDIGLVYQAHGLVPQLPAVHNAALGRLYDQRGGQGMFTLRPEDREDARTYLEHLGLGERLELACSKLSGGEQQRVGIARMLVQAPSVALLDEPVSHLDVHWSRRALEAISEIRGGSATSIMVLHNLELVRDWADRAILLEDGEIVADGPPDRICSTLESGPRQTPANTGSTEPTSEPDAAATNRRSDRTPRGESRSGGGSPLESEPAPGTDETSDDPQPGIPRWVFYAAIMIALGGAYVWALYDIDISVVEIFDNLGDAGKFIGRLWPPNLTAEVLDPVGASLIETIQMALISTTIAAGISLPIAFLAARNMTPWFVRGPARLFLNLLRTVPSIIWGLFFVILVGLGPAAGVFALTFYASGYLGKFYYEGIESLDPHPIRALKTVGASPAQQFRWGVLPQFLPLFLSYTLYMFEYNVRSASILGIVGAGGIGFYLYTYINNFNYPKATTALLALLAVVTVIDFASSQLRARLTDTE
jgi:phosphonate transport system permease protein